MKRYINLIACLFFVATIHAQKELQVQSKIKAVTVYEQSAQVERKGSVSLSKGACHLKFTDLPAYLDKDKIRFNATGDITIQSMFFSYRNDTLNKAELKPLANQGDYEFKIAQQQKQIRALDGKIAIFKNEEQLLKSNSDFKSKEDGVDIDRLEKAASLLRARYLELHNTLLKLEEEKLALSESINQMQLARNRVQNVKVERWLELHVIANAAKAGKSEFSISYQTNHAGWTPFYDARVTSISQPIALDYQAKVYQNSGEKWEGIELTLSTGKPQRNYTKPQLSPWLLGHVEPTAPPVYSKPNVRRSNGPNQWLSEQPYNSTVREVSGQIIDAKSGELLPFVNVLVAGTNTGTTSDIDGRYRISIPANARQLTFSSVGYQSLTFNVSKAVMNVHMNESAQLLSAVEVSSDNIPVKRLSTLSVASIEKSSRIGFRKNRTRKPARALSISNEYAPIRAAYSPTNVRFTAELPYDIPSDGKKYSVHLSTNELAATYEYACSPKVDAKAYLTARITDWELLDLLPGSANIYFEGTFVGRTAIDPSFADDTLAVSLGVDEAVRVDRYRVTGGTKKQLLSGRRKDSREWRIEVRNNKTVPISLKIDDQIPVSRTEEITVELNKDAGAELDKEQGILTWNLELKPSSKSELRFKYTVERPKGSHLILE